MSILVCSMRCSVPTTAGIFDTVAFLPFSPALSSAPSATAAALHLSQSSGRLTLDHLCSPPAPSSCCCAATHCTRRAATFIAHFPGHGAQQSVPKAETAYRSPPLDAAPSCRPPARQCSRAQRRWRCRARNAAKGGLSRRCSRLLSGPLCLSVGCQLAGPADLPRHSAAGRPVGTSLGGGGPRSGGRAAPCEHC